MLSHGSAAELLLIEKELPGRIELTVPAERHPRGTKDIVIHRLITPAADITTHRGIPTSSPAKTLLDLAIRLPSHRLEAAINAADKHDLIDPPALRAYVDERPGQSPASAPYEPSSTATPSSSLTRSSNAASSPSPKAPACPSR